MSAALLRKAAAVLQTMALDANDSGSPWRRDYTKILGADGETIATTEQLRAPGIWEAEWIALMHPGVAAPLAAWLRGFAEDIDDGLHPLHLQHALAVARVIVGEDA